MDNSFWQKLADAARDQGPSLWSGAARCRSFLLDYYGSVHEPEIALLANAVQLGVPTALLSNGGSIPLDALITAKTRELQAKYFLTDEAARWAVQGWMFALQIPIPTKIPAPTSVPKQVPPSGPSNQPPRKPPKFTRLLIVALLIAAAAIYWVLQHPLKPIPPPPPSQSTPTPSLTWTPEQWDKATRRVTLPDEMIDFRPGTTTMVDGTEDKIKDALSKLEGHPGWRLIVEAHASPGNSAEADQKFSEERADEVKRFLIQECKVPEDHILARGFGSSNRPPRIAGETQREWERRARVVRILLVGD